MMMQVGESPLVFPCGIPEAPSSLADILPPPVADEDLAVGPEEDHEEGA
jgi:hypothetical protein